MLPILLLSCTSTGNEPTLPDPSPSETGETTSPPDDSGDQAGDSGKTDDTGEKQKPSSDKPITVVMIGDGMGDGQRDAASLYAYGETGQLVMEQLPYRGTVTTSSLSGVTDSAASATAMATGAITWNGVVGMDRNNVEVQSLVELAANNVRRLSSRRHHDAPPQRRLVYPAQCGSRS